MSRRFRPLGVFGPIFWGLVIGGVVHLSGGSGVLIGLYVWVFLLLILNFVEIARLLELMDECVSREPSTRRLVIAEVSASSRSRRASWRKPESTTTSAFPGISRSRAGFS